MKLIDMLSLSTRMFRTRPLRTFLTVLGVGVGIGTVLFLVSLGYGLQQTILNRISSADALLSLEVTPGPSDALRLTPVLVQELEAMPDVGEVSRLKGFSTQISSGDITSNGVVYGIDHSFFRLQGLVPSAGELYKADDRYMAIISTAGAQLLNIPDDDAIGKTVSLTLSIPSEEGDSIKTVPQEKAFTIVGVSEDESVNYLYVSINDINGVPIESFDQLKVKVKSNEVMEQVRSQILERGFLVSALSDTIDEANRVFGMIQLILGLFGLVALTVSAIGMFNTMTITLLERTNEIGIMRSIGVTRRDVRRLFLVESMFMSFLGGVSGIILGLIGGELANIVINHLAKRSGGGGLDLFYAPPWFILFIIVFSTSIGFLTGVYPSRRAAKLNPLDALRYK